MTATREPEAPAPTGPTLPGRVIRSPRGRVSVRLDVRTTTICLGLVVAIVLVGILALTTGDFPLSFGEVVRALVGSGSPAHEFVVLTLRLPRLLTGILVGIALGLGGAVFQSLARNPLGSPDIIGFNTGAATGAVLAILVAGASSAGIAASAVAGGVVTALAVYVLAFKRGVHGYRLVLIGIGISAMLLSVNDYLLTRAKLEEAQSAALWLLGSLNGRGWEHVVPVALVLAVLVPVLLSFGRKLRLLEMGDDAASALGIPVERTRLILVVVSVAISAVAIASAGPITFVALAAPQLARQLCRSPGVGLVSSALMGAFLLTVSDLLAQRLFTLLGWLGFDVAAGTQLPVGVMTGAIGGLYLAWLLTREWRSGRG